MLSNNIDRTPEGVLTFAGYDVTQLAKEYGTPLYLMDEARIRANCRMYLQAFRDHFGPGSLPLYASKAASFKQMYRIMAEEGMGVDVVSSGELYTALSAGFPAERIYFHGNCKTDADLAYGVSQGIGFFVADNQEELLALEKTAAEANVTQKILLRVTPGIDPHTYEAVSTGKVDSKFGAAVDGGMTDNPRYALYQSRYTVYHAHKSGSMERFDVVGRCCESGDIIQPGVELPGDTCRGDILAVCTTGAYNYSMASNYNRLPRPAVVMLTPDRIYEAVRRETFADLTGLDL